MQCAIVRIIEVAIGNWLLSSLTTYFSFKFCQFHSIFDIELVFEDRRASVAINGVIFPTSYILANYALR